jgi:hypothetical protein
MGRTGDGMCRRYRFRDRRYQVVSRRGRTGSRVWTVRFTSAMPSFRRKPNRLPTTRMPSADSSKSSYVPVRTPAGSGGRCRRRADSSPGGQLMAARCSSWAPGKNDGGRGREPRGARLECQQRRGAVRSRPAVCRSGGEAAGERHDRKMRRGLPLRCELEAEIAGARPMPPVGAPITVYALHGG